MGESGAIKTQYVGGETVSVLLPLPLSGAYDYRVPKAAILEAGQFVAVPLGRRRAVGVVWGNASGEVEPARLKEIGAPLAVPPLPPVSRRFVDWVAAYTLSPPGAVLKMAMSVPDALEPPKPAIGYVPAEKIPAALKLTPARKRVLDAAAIVKESGGPPRVAADLARAANAGAGVVKGLADAGALVARTLPEAGFAPPDWRRPGLVLSAAQAEAARDLAAKTKAKTFSVTVLDGVPGAGKTEVYFQAVAAALEAGRQALVLLPEIALGAQWLSRFRDRFGVEPAVWHSDIGQAARRAAWRAVADGRARVVVGARSALFLPFRDLGLIVVDEEHDGSYKQEEGVIYNARDMAVVRARLGAIPAILASATPSLETVANVEAGRYAVRHLPDRHGGARLPHVTLIDMRAEKLGAGRWLSAALQEQIARVLAEGEQAMLFLNRRGYAPLTLCRGCGHRFRCPHCSAWLVEHRGRAGESPRASNDERRAMLRCHHCGFASALPEHCPQCQAQGQFAACGPGVERLAEEAHQAFPAARIALAASDTLAGPEAAARLVRRVEDGEIDLLIGTQIVAKGYHFPMLTLVGVVDADLGLAGGDLRATERTYQLLYQVAGRAGRGDRPGKVLLQTFMPEHPVMAALAAGDRDRFLAAEAAARREAAMPPFGRLVALIVSGEKEAEVERAARALAATAPRDQDIRVLGPAPAPLALLRGRHRRRFLLKAPRETQVQPIVRAWLARADVPRAARVQIDVDPYGFL